MNPEIENCLSALRDRPQDLAILRTLQDHVRSGAGTSDEEILSALGRSLEHHQQQGDWEAAVGLIDLSLPQVADEARKLELLSLKGRILEEELLDEEAAIEAYQEVLTIQPDHTPTRETIDHIQLIRENWEKVAAKYIEEAEAVADSDRQLSTSLFLSAAEVIWRNTSDDARVEQFLRRSLEVEPRNHKASGHLERMLRKQGRLEQLAELYEQRADVAATRDDRVAAFLAAGDLWAADLDKLDEAATRYKRALSLDPTNPKALKQLVRTLTAQENWTALVRFYEEALRGRPQGAQELQILLQMGSLYHEKLEQAGQAEEYFRRVRKLDPTNRAMLAFYRAYFSERGEPGKLLPALDTAQRAEQDPGRRMELAREMASVAEEDVGNLEKAIDIWKGIQRMDPGARDAAVALKRLYRQTQPPKWNALRELIKEEIDGLGDDPESVARKVELLMEVVEIYRDHLRLDVMVINTYNAILALAPDHTEAMEALTEKYEALGRWNDLIGLLMRRKDAQTDLAEKIETLHRVAGLWIERFSNQTQAIPALQEILEIQPAEPRALGQLKEVYRRRRNWRELIELYRMEVANTSGPARRELFSEMAKLAAERLGEPSEGIQVWNQVLAEEDPADPEALAELSALYRREERWPALAEVLHRRVEAVREDPGQAMELLESLGEIYTNRLRAVDNAMQVWQEVLRLKPESAKARAVLRGLYVQQKRWEELEQLFAERGEYSELAETLAAAADRSDDRELKVQLYTRVGKLCRDRLEHTERAMKAFERVLAIEPQSEAAAKALVPIYEDAERWGRLLSVYEVLFERADDPGDRLELIDRIRQLYETHLESKHLAFQWSLKAFAIEPENASVRADMERLAAESDSWEQLVEVYVDRLPHVGDLESKAALLRHLAYLCGEKLHRPEDAEVFHRDLLELHPDEIPALESLEEIYSSTQRWEGLVDVYRRRVPLEAGIEGKVSYLFKIAQIQEERLGEVVSAVQTLQDVLEVETGNLRALRTLARLYEVRAEWFPLVDALQRMLAQVEEPEERVELLFRLGEILQSKLDAAEDGVSALAEALSLDPFHRGTIQALERHLVVGEPHRVRVAGVLEPVYERGEDWARLVQVTEILLEAEEDHGKQLALLKRLMSLHERRFANLEAAFAAGSRILALDPADRDIRRQMTQLAERLDRVDELAGLLVDALARLREEGAEPQLVVALSWELSVLLDEQLGRPEEAERHLRQIIELQRDHHEAYEMLERILRDSGEWTGLRELLEERRGQTSDPAIARDILLQISALNENVLEDIPAAIRAYEQILTIEPDHNLAFKSLERHYAAEGRWQDLLDLLRREMDLATDNVALNELKLAQAELLTGHLDDHQASVDLLEEVVSVDPHSDRGVALLEQLLGSRDELKRRITEILEPVYDRREDWGSLVGVLRVRRSLTEDRYEAVELLCRVAVLLEERLMNAAAAFDAYVEALTLDAAASHVHEALRRLAGELDRWTEAAQAWQAAFEALDPGDLALRARLLAWVAETYDFKLSDTATARGFYEQLVELDPSSPETAKPASQALGRIYEQEGRWNELVGVLRRQLGWAEEAAGRETVLLRIGRLQEEVLGDLSAAVETYRELLEESPSYGEALDALERLYLQSERWSELVGIYRRRVELASDSEVRRLHLMRIATLYEEEIADLDQAIAAYLSVLDELPEDLESLRALARIYRGSERWSDLLEMLERELALAEDEGGQVDLLFEAATVEHRRLQEPAVAIDRYCRVLGARPGHRGTREALEELLEAPEHRSRVAEVLIPIYRGESEWDQLVKVHELLAELAPPGERIRQLREVARLCEEGLGSPERAFDAYRRALREAAAEPEALELMEQLQRIARLLDRWREFAEAVEGMVVDVLDSATRMAFHLTLAEVWSGELGDLERARDHYQQALDVEPTHQRALEALDELYQRLEQWEGLLEVVNRRVELAASDDDRRDLLLRSAVICRDMLERPSEAIAAYERVLELVPNDPVAMPALEILYKATERWVELAELLERKLERCEDLAQRATVYFDLGRLRANKLDDPVRAVDAYRQVLALDPQNEQAVAALEAYLESPDLQAEAARILQPYYVGRQDWPRLIRIYQIRLEAAGDHEERLALSTRIAQLYEEQLEDLEGAFTWYSKVYLEKPTDVAIRDQILRLAGILDRWEEVAGVLAQHLDQTFEESETVRRAAIILGAIYDERLYQVNEAAACFRRVLDTNRLDGEAFEHLESLLTRAERWDDLLELYRETADAAADEEARRELMLKICRVWEEALYNLPEAIDAYRAVLDMSPRDEETITALDRLYTETERWHDLCDLLIRCCESAESDLELIELKLRLGTIYELRLDDLPTSIDYFEEVLRQDPDQPRAIAAMERLILDRDQRFRIAQILEPIYKSQDEWAKLVVIYDAQLDFIDDPERRGHMLREIARLHEERGGSLDLAFRALCRAFEEEFGDQELLEQIERLAAKLNNWGEVVHVLKHGVERVYDNDLLARMQARIATLMEERLGDQNGAVTAWRQVLGAREDSAEALASLIRLLSVLERHEELVEVLHRKAELAPDQEEQKATYYQIAMIYENILSRPEKAVEAYRQVLALDESDWAALDALDRLYRMAENWMELIWTYRQKIELTRGPEQQRELQLQVARVYDERVGDSFEAISAYRQLLEQDPSDGEALDALDRLYTKEDLHSDLLDVLERKVRLEADLERRIALSFRAATLLEEQIGDVEGAIARYWDVLEAMEDHKAALEALERLLADEGHRETVAGLLERHYSRTGEVEPLTRVLELRLELLADPAARRDLLMRIGRLREEGLHDAPGGFAAYARAFAEVPDDEEAQQELERVTTVVGDFAQLVEVYETRLKEIYDTLLSQKLHHKVAQLAEEVLGNDAKAEQHYRAALDAGGDNMATLRLLDRVVERQGKWSELVEVIEREIQVVAEPDQQADLYFRTGAIRLSEHDDVDGAFSALRNALERNPDHRGALETMERLLSNETYRVPALDVLEPLYERSGEHAKVVELVEVRLSTVADPADRIALLERIAKIHEERLGSRDDALGTLGRALSEDPANERVLEEVDRLAGELARYPELVALADEVLAGEITAEAARALGLRTAHWHGAKLNDVERSERCLKRVLELDPECTDAMNGLEQIYRTSGEARKLAEVLARRAELELDGSRRRELLVELARIRDSLDDVEGAVEAWRAVLGQDPADRVALAALVALYDRREAWEDLLDVLGRQAQSAEIDEQVELKHRMAELVVEKLQDPARAVDLYRDILDLRPGNGRALDGLEQIHAAREDWPALQEVLLWRLEVLEGRERVPVFRRLAALAQEKLENVDEAVGYYHQILSVDEGNEDALGLLEATLRQAERWYDLVDILRRHATLRASIGDTSGEVEQLVAAARIWTDKLENPEAAAEILEEILQRDERNVNALAGLARIYESTEQWDRCRDALERAAALGPEPREAAELEFRMGRVLVAQTQDVAQAEGHYRQALGHDSTHREALEALEALYRERSDWGQLADVLELKVRVPGLDRQDQLKVLMELGVVYADRVAQPERGVEMLELARQLEPDDPEVLAGLADAYYAADRLDEAEPLIQRLIEVAGTKKRRELAQYVYRLGAIAEKRGDVTAAREHYDKAYRMDSTNTPTLVALGRMYMQEQDWESARRVYRSMLLQNLDDRAGITKADVFYNLGQVHAALGENSKAKGMYERGLEAEPDHPQLKAALEQLK